MTLQEVSPNGGAIAPYKYPRSVTFIEELPKTQTGKIQRFRLRQAGAADQF
jgi:2-aminobenzoate-CoA ligase|tara:strand:- start:178 stop:330 length:153 start_codon:yes stop_codon:yes gene_type:complete